MLQYILDAFNLTRSGAVGRLADSNDEHRDLIYFISEKHLTGSTRNRVTIIFDGHQPAGFRNPQPRFQIRFSNNLTADEVIRKLVAGHKQPGNLIVVSDDREIRDCVGALGARTVGSREFLTGGRRMPAGGGDKKLDPGLGREITDELSRYWLDED